jgi:arginine-tRNA-protein transferase
MLLEIQYGQEKGFQYYYPGYVTPGFSRFDYKIRIGKVEYLDITDRTWKPYQALSSETLPIEALKEKLDILSEALTTLSVKNEIYYYPFFDITLTSYWNNNYLGYPIFLWCKIHSDYTTFIMFSYNLVTQNYVVLQCSLEHEFPPMLEPLCEAPYEDQAAFLEVLVVRSAVTLSASPSHIAEVMMQWDTLKHNN